MVTALQSGYTLVVSPLIALMRDQMRSCEHVGLRAATFNSQQSSAENFQALEGLEKSEIKVLFVAPESLEGERLRRWLTQFAPALLVVDEAHCVLQWGDDFRPAYKNLGWLKRQFAAVALLAQTATVTSDSRREILDSLAIGKAVVHDRGFQRDNLFFQVKPCETSQCKDAHLKSAVQNIASALGDQRENDQIYVYCSTRQRCEQVASTVSQYEGSVQFYHAGLSAQERRAREASVARSETRVLIATNAFGLGVDAPRVRAVIHYDAPSNVEAYYQEIGRSGRSGCSALGLLLYEARDWARHRFLIQTMPSTSTAVRARRYADLNALISYVESTECRNVNLARHFSGPSTGPIANPDSGLCGRCDVCAPEASAFQWPRIKRPRSSNWPLGDWRKYAKSFKISHRSAKRSAAEAKSRVKSAWRHPLDDEALRRAVLFEAWRQREARRRGVLPREVATDGELLALVKSFESEI